MSRPTRKVRTFVKSENEGEESRKSQYHLLSEMTDDQHDESVFGGEGQRKRKRRPTRKGKGRRSNPRRRDGQILEKSFTRTVWELKKAEWSKIEHEMTVFDWSTLRQGTAEDSLSYFLELLWNLLIKYIPREDIVSRKSTHPWLNERCRNALVHKNSAEGTSHFEAERLKCIQILRGGAQKICPNNQAETAESETT